MEKNLQKISSNWDYDESVKTTKFLVSQFKKCSLDIVRELYWARENLSAPGYRSDLKIETTSCKMAQGNELHTFAEYLEEIGLSRRTAYNWLSLYSPTEDKLYSVEEMKLKISNLFEEVYNLRKSNPQYKPAGWDNKQELAYQKWEEKAHPNFLSEDVVQKEYKEFDREYLNILSKTMDNPTPDDIMRQMELCKKYQDVATKEAPVQDQMHIVRYVEKALEMFDEDKRADIALSIAKVLQLIAIDSEMEE
jgi:hypothetical protein